MGFAGGAYGGKGSKSVPCALAASLASHFTGGSPAKVRLELNKNLRSLGSRRPHRLDYEVGCSTEGKILGIQAKIYYLQGAFLDFGDMGGLDALMMSLDGMFSLSPSLSLIPLLTLFHTQAPTTLRIGTSRDLSARAILQATHFVADRCSCLELS